MASVRRPAVTRAEMTVISMIVNCFLNVPVPD
jgi:hypothetical protein